MLEAQLDPGFGIRLRWTGPVPSRDLELRPHAIGGHINWLFNANFSQLERGDPGSKSVEGAVAASVLTPAMVDDLIYLLFDQETWGVGQIPAVKMPGTS